MMDTAERRFSRQNDRKTASKLRASERTVSSTIFIAHLNAVRKESALPEFSRLASGSSINKRRNLN
jgi:hypothetical protein